MFGNKSKVRHFEFYLTSNLCNCSFWISQPTTFIQDVCMILAKLLEKKRLYFLPNFSLFCP